MRKDFYNAPLSTIRTDSELIDHIARAGYTLESVLESGKMLQLRGNSNIGTGGTMKEITHILHPDTIQMCSDIAKKLDMQLCCIDIISTDFSQPLSATHGAILEVGGNPGFG